MEETLHEIARQRAVVAVLVQLWDDFAVFASRGGRVGVDRIGGVDC